MLWNLYAPLVSFVPARARVMYGLLLSPRYKELRQVDELWAAFHRDMSKEERKAACLQVIEQYETGLIDLMVVAAQFGREEIIISEEDNAQTGSCTHNTCVHTFGLILIHTIIEHTFSFKNIHACKYTYTYFSIYTHVFNTHTYANVHTLVL